MGEHAGHSPFALYYPDLVHQWWTAERVYTLRGAEHDRVRHTISATWLLTDGQRIRAAHERHRDKAACGHSCDRASRGSMSVGCHSDDDHIDICFKNDPQHVHIYGVSPGSRLGNGVVGNISRRSRNQSFLETLKCCSAISFMN